MTYRMYLTALIGCLGLALTIVPNESFGASGAGHGGSGSAHGGRSSFQAFRFSHISHIRHVNKLRLGHANKFRFRFSFLRFNNRFSLLRFNNQRNLGAIWPASGYFYDPGLDPYESYPSTDVTGPTSGGVNYTNPYDIPWDAAHRYPWGVTNNGLQSVNVEPNVELSFGPACRSQSVTVPWSDGKDQTVNIVRC
jgi:hypothetical protein